MGSNGRFDIITSIGRGGQGQTYLARDRNTGEQVALKRLALRLVDNWKALELFEREGRVLQNLSHPQIPSFITAFVDETDDGPRFYLAQEYVDGRSLQQYIDEGERWDVERARSFLRSLLGVLEYLGSLRPPIVHRDIKPANIIQRPDGTWVLVDFGAVQAIVPATAGGSTVVGTTGYVPPEQVMGRAEPASDQYALGATVAHLMTGEHPGDLSEGGLRLDLREYLHAPGAFVECLERMLAPCPEDRFESAAAALESLETLDLSAGSELERSDDGELAPVEFCDRASRMDLLQEAARLDLPATMERERVCFSVWSPLMPPVFNPPREGRMVGAAWCAMAASAFLITGGWILSGLVAALLSFGFLFGLAGRFTQLEVGGGTLAIMRGSSLFHRVGARMPIDSIDDVVARDSQLLVLVGVREYVIPMETRAQADRLSRLLRTFVLRTSERPRPLAKQPTLTLEG
ncbi:MAG: serine/threonine protein kinase [Myxococcota bacterium]